MSEILNNNSIEQDVSFEEAAGAVLQKYIYMERRLPALSLALRPMKWLLTLAPSTPATCPCHELTDDPYRQNPKTWSKKGDQLEPDRPPRQ